MTALVAAALAALIPLHGVVIQMLPDRSAIVRTDVVPGMRPVEIRRYRFEPPATFPDNTSIDALLDDGGRPPIMRSPVAAAAFAPGLPDAGRVVPVTIGSRLPAAELVDQNGRLVKLGSAFDRKTLAALVRLHALPRPHALSGDQRKVRLSPAAARSGALRDRRNHARSAVRFSGDPARVRRRARRSGRRLGAVNRDGFDHHSRARSVQNQLDAREHEQLSARRPPLYRGAGRADRRYRRDGRAGIPRASSPKRARFPGSPAIPSSASSWRSSPRRSRFAAAVSPPASRCSSSRSSRS